MQVPSVVFGKFFYPDPRFQIQCCYWYYMVNKDGYHVSKDNVWLSNEVYDMMPFKPLIHFLTTNVVLVPVDGAKQFTR